MVRITGRRLEASIPGFLASAGSTACLVAYLERCVEALGRDPSRYGFDPASTYTLLVQTWDRALSPVRSLAWGRDKLGHQAVGLIPDFYFIANDGFSDLRRNSRDGLRWSERDPALVWRGSVTSSGSFPGPGDIPRIKLALRCKSIAMTDVRLITIGATMTHDMPFQVMSDFVQSHDLFGDTWPMSRFGQYRYIVDIDGFGNAWGFIEKLILGCCVLKVDSPWEQWFYRRIEPGVHYVPIRADLGDLEEKIAWCRDNEAQCAWIAANGARLAAAMTFEAELARSCEQIMLTARPAPLAPDALGGEVAP